MIIPSQFVAQKDVHFAGVKMPTLAAHAYEVLNWVLENASSEVWMVDYNKEDGCVYIFGRQGVLLANPGDWILLDPTGGYMTLSEEKMAKMYTLSKGKA